MFLKNKGPSTMAFRVDQAPHDNSDPSQDPSQQDNNHPERLDPGSQRGFGEPRPGDPVDPIDRDPNERSKTKRNTFIALGSLGAASALVIGAYFGVKGAAHETAKELIGNIPSTSAPVNPGESEVTSTSAYGLELDSSLPFLQKNRQNSLSEISAELEAQNRTPLPDPSAFENDPNKKFAQTLSNNLTADKWTASAQQDPGFGKSLVGGFEKPDSAAYNATVNQIGNGQGKILAPTLVNSASGKFTSGVVAGVPTNGRETMIIEKVNLTDGSVYEDVVTSVISQDGKSTDFVVAATYQPGNVNYVNDPSTYSSVQE